MDEFISLPEMEAEMERADLPTWNLFVDGSLGETESGTDIVLVSPEEHKINCAVRFGFKAINNMAKYEAFMAGLRLARKMQVKRLYTSCDSHLVVSQVNGNFAAKDKSIVAYFKQVIKFLSTFKKLGLVQIP